MNDKNIFLANAINNQNKNILSSKKMGEKPFGYKELPTHQNSLNLSSAQRRNSGSQSSAVTNKLASAGLTAAGVPKVASDAIVQSKMGQKALDFLKKKNPALRLFDKLMGGSKQKQNEEEEETEATFKNLAITAKVIITTIMAMPGVILVIVFCCLFIAASQIFINSIDIGTADSLNNDQTEEKINNNKDNWNNEINDDHENLSYISETDTYILDIYDDVNYVQVARKYNEADLDELNDFYGTAIYENPNIDSDADMNLVYNFYFKLYYLYTYYQEQYNVDLDLPLLMATLNVQSKDKTVVFGSNTIGYDDEVSLKQNNERFAYDKQHIYKSTSNNSEYDMEVLAQNMVSKQATETCVDSNGKEVSKNILRDAEIGTQVLTCEDNQTYNVTEAKYDIDEEKYREFLPQYLEEKYFLNGVSSSSGSTSSNDGSNEYISDGDTKTCSLTIIGNKYYKTVYPQNSNCFVSGFSGTEKGLEPAFYKNLKALIEDAKSKGCNASIISGHRTYEKQAYLYECYITKKCNNGNMAAQPGYSNHEYGIAADLSYSPYTQTCLNYYHTNAAKYGLEFPLLYASFPEDWHIEPIDIIVGSPQE